MLGTLEVLIGIMDSLGMGILFISESFNANKIILVAKKEFDVLKKSKVFRYLFFKNVVDYDLKVFRDSYFL